MKQDNTEYIYGITSSPQEIAEHIAKSIVDEKQAAGVQIIGPVTSFYWWKGEVQKDTEAILLLKTKQECIPQIKHIIKEIHPYEIPELIFLPVLDGLPDYLHWIDEITKKREDK